ncbi:hypothetical protein GGR56DRAFT_649412 [Xylariaceae sp. FL0804]|nr:hypothetical protein GGR56DRAFT_649412 [Xylariaceae sp. FL0804]
MAPQRKFLLVPVLFPEPGVRKLDSCSSKVHHQRTPRLISDMTTDRPRQRMRIGPSYRKQAENSGTATLRGLAAAGSATSPSRLPSSRDRAQPFPISAHRRSRRRAPSRALELLSKGSIRKEGLFFSQEGKKGPAATTHHHYHVPHTYLHSRRGHLLPRQCYYLRRDEVVSVRVPVARTVVGAARRGASLSLSCLLFEFFFFSPSVKTAILQAPAHRSPSFARHGTFV